jgi:hypothetical protein
VGEIMGKRIDSIVHLNLVEHIKLLLVSVTNINRTPPRNGFPWTHLTPAPN